MEKKYTCYWEHECYVCDAPLEIHDLFEGYNVNIVYTSLYKYQKLNPCYIVNNTVMYRFFGQRVRRVCVSCFHDRLPFNPIMNMRRECGLREIRIKTKSVSKDELWMWCKGFNRHLSRPRR